MYNKKMGNLTKFLLKPLFDVLAKPGLQAPHERYETELMLAGKKPAMITTWPLKDTKLGQYTKLQPLIDNGSIVVIGTITAQLGRHIICNSEHLESSYRFADLERKIKSRSTCTDDEMDFYRAFRKNAMGTATINEFIERYNHPQKTRRETDLLLTGKIGATVPISTGVNLKGIPIKTKKMVESGSLHATLIDNLVATSVVISPKSFVDAGKELFARYFNDNEGYETLSGDEWIKRIGELLGYSPADTEFFIRVKSTPPSEYTAFDRILFATSDLRKYARAQSLLMDTPTPL